MRSVITAREAYYMDSEAGGTQNPKLKFRTHNSINGSDDLSLEFGIIRVINMLP